MSLFKGILKIKSGRFSGRFPFVRLTKAARNDILDELNLRKNKLIEALEVVWLSLVWNDIIKENEGDE